MQIPYTAPTYDGSAFNCALCGAYAQQRWLNIYYLSSGYNPTALRYSCCDHCLNVSLWYKRVMIDPDVIGAPTAHSMMPADARGDYDEAKSLVSRSPRAAAALLRLCLQKLCNELGNPRNNIDQNIALLVSKGLPTEVQRALDIVRVVGNEQVHPGTLDLRDNPDVANELFQLINFIVEDRIARPAAIKELYDKLPSSKLAGIEARDRKRLEAPASVVSESNARGQ